MQEGWGRGLPGEEKAMWLMAALPMNHRDTGLLFCVLDRITLSELGSRPVPVSPTAAAAAALDEASSFVLSSTNTTPLLKACDVRRQMQVKTWE